MSGSLLNQVGNTIFKLAYQISPIIFAGGIANKIPGGYLPIVTITEAATLITGLLSGGTNLSLDSFFASWDPAPGSTINRYEVGMYPFANQSVAANALIQQPLNISMIMTCPARAAGAFTSKIATMTALQYAIDQHANLGGTYIIATPAILWLNCLLTEVKDISNLGPAQPQSKWQFDFVKPLVSLADAAGALSSLMNKVTNGLPTDGATSGASATVGNSLSGASPAVVPASTNLTGAGVSTFQSAAPIPVTSSPL